MLPPILARWAVKRASVVLHLYAIAKGAAILATSADRWNPPTYAVALSAPGRHVGWGLVMLAAGVVGLVATLAHRERVIAAALVLSGTWSLFFALAFGLSAARSHTASFDPATTQLLVAVLCYLVAVTYWQGRSRDEASAAGPGTVRGFPPTAHPAVLRAYLARKRTNSYKRDNGGG